MDTAPSNLIKHLSTPVPAKMVTPTHQGTAVTSRQAVSRASLLSLAKEPEDARLTGGTRSLDRRLLALNLSRPGVKPVAVKSVQAAPSPNAA
jgi:hypothetical protein